MVIDERSRHQMYLKLEDALGSEEAQTLMEHLPPVGWADVATKKDLEHMAEAIRRDLETTKHELIGMFRGEIATAITSQTRTLLLMFIGALLSIVGLAFGAGRLA